MNKIIITFTVVFLGACATRTDPGLSLPYSEQVDIIHSYEAVNFIPVDKGEKDIVLFFKSSPQDVLDQYRTFDTYALSQYNAVYQSINKRRAASRMRKYIRAKLKQYKYKHVGRSLSQAGIAITVSSYQKILGKNIEEMMLIVFDRKKAWKLSRENRDLRGVRLLKETAVWVGVVRKQPEQQKDISKSVHYISKASFQQMADLMFETFMKDSNYIPLN